MSIALSQRKRRDRIVTLCWNIFLLFSGWEKFWTFLLSSRLHMWSQVWRKDSVAILQKRNSMWIFFFLLRAGLISKSKSKKAKEQKQKTTETKQKEKRGTLFVELAQKKVKEKNQKKREDKKISNIYFFLDFCSSHGLSYSKINHNFFTSSKNCKNSCFTKHSFNFSTLKKDQKKENEKKKREEKMKKRKSKNEKEESSQKRTKPKKEEKKTKRTKKKKKKSIEKKETFFFLFFFWSTLSSFCVS